MKDMGMHLLIELFDCEPEALSQPEQVESAALAAVNAAGAKYLQHGVHNFEPGGVTVYILLAESHLSVHTWPEKRYAAADFFSCGSGMKPESAVTSLKESLKSERCQVTSVSRGSTLEFM